MAKIEKVAPWIEYYYQVWSLFREDPDIHVMIDEAAQELRIYVESEPKADALRTLLPTEKTWGNARYYIHVIPANKKRELTSEEAAEWFRLLFTGNPAVVKIARFEMLDITYVIFARDVVQYYDDSISSAYGVKSTLYEDLARAVFEPVNGVFYCTDIQGDDEIIIGGKTI